uniref:NADH:ubiquinone reductase (H(+)-translocating) n=1 Tax=Thelazia callipaeda TaxID=103827 RepID=A0A343IPD2_THECL|nr:NADH dehydrogenase subunit 5 [Thelazia callipaeda]
MLFIFYIVFFYFFLGILVLFLPYGKWFFCLGRGDFFSFFLSFNFEIVLFLFVLLFVSFMVFLFGFFYMGSSVRLFYFFIILFSFVMSTVGLIIFSGSIVVTLFFWDFLGLSSFFLVLFYNNVVSRSGAMSTVFTNRVGDFCIFLFFNGFVFFTLSILSYQFFNCLISLMLFLAGFIKGGQYPFGSWLPKAMAAPTPVSCLVHSSTLVTAGVMLMDFYFYVCLSSFSLSVVFFVGFFTIFFSGLCALLEQDAKKIVALSTMSQIGFCFLCMGSGYHYVSFVHMIGHSFFKSLLFMQVGYIIYLGQGLQDYRGFSGGFVSVPLIVRLQILVSLFCLCGLLFTSGGLSKEYFISCFYSGSFGFFLVFFYFLGVFFTFCYSLRLFNIFGVFNLSFDFVGFSSKIFFFSGFFLVFFSVFFIFWLFMNFLCLSIKFCRFESLVWLLYFFLVFCLFNFFFNYNVLEFKNKFFMDSFSLFIYRFFPKLFYLDNFIFFFNYFFFSFVSFFSFFFSFVLRGGVYSGFFLLFFFFLFFCIF